jgi:hypothetical protein
MRRAALLAACFLVAATGVQAATQIIYVDDDANGLNDGSSWSNAYWFLQDALTDAKSAEKSVEIRVAQGVYKPDRSAANPKGTLKRDAAFFVSDEMSLLGGYAGVRASDPNARDCKSYETILSGDLLGNDAPVTDPAALKNDRTRYDNSQVLRITSRTSRHIGLEGCVITGGAYGAVYVWRPPSLTGASDVTISDCAFRDNGPTQGDYTVAAALHDACSCVAVRHCSFVRHGGEGGA